MASKTGIFFKKRQAQDLQNFVKAPIQLQFLFDDGHKDVHADGDPDLSLYSIHTIAIESLDSQMLLDPLEEQFDLPGRWFDPPATPSLCRPRD